MHALVLTYIAMRWFLALWCGLGTVQEFLSAVNNKDVNEPVALDKAKQRLQQLEGKVDRVELSQKDMMAQVQKHGADLTTAWKRSERVKSLKISIQVQPLDSRCLLCCLASPHCAATSSSHHCWGLLVVAWPSVCQTASGVVHAPLLPVHLCLCH